MQIIETIITDIGDAYSLALKDDGNYIITDSSGITQEIDGVAEAEALDILYYLDPNYWK